MRKWRAECTTWFFVFGLALVDALVSYPARAQDLPELNSLIISKDHHELQDRLRSHEWSGEELGAALIAAAGVDDVFSIDIIVAAGAPIDYEVLSRTPLWVAVTEGNTAAVERLLEYGANANYVGNFEWRPLHQAITADRADLNIIALLLKHGAEIDARTNLGVSALHRAAGFCEIEAVDLLVKNRANLSALDGKGLTAKDRAVSSGCQPIPDSLQ